MEFSHLFFLFRGHLIAGSVALLGMSGISFAADYNYLDPGDYYYINDFGADNRRVVVVRKMGNGGVKVRNLATGESQVVQASRLLTKSELSSEEMGNKVGVAVGGAALLYCIVTGNCKSDE